MTASRHDAPLERRKQRAAQLYVRVFGAGDLAVADDILAENCVGHGPGMPPLTGTEAIKRQAMLLRTAMPDLACALEEQVGENDRVASLWRATGTHTGVLHLPTGDVQPSGNRIEFTELRIDRFEGERIVESWFIPDRFTLWQQLGLFPAPSAPPEAATSGSGEVRS